MATKKELLAAQSFSRRRLLTAFVSGAPGGRELEPAKPLRGVVAGVVLSVLVIVGSLIAGLFGDTLPAGWEENSLVVIKEDGARYVARNGTLHPVYNITSARLLASPEGFQVVTVSEDQIAGMPRGGVTVGIEGAPDALPTPANLIPTGWLSCATADVGTWTELESQAAPVTRATGALVVVEGQHYYVAGGYRYPIDAEDLSSTFELTLHVGSPVGVPATWLNLFEEGAPIGPLVMAGSGDPLAGPAADLAGFGVGSVVRLRNAQGDVQDPYVFDGDSQLVPLTPLALAMYSLGSGIGDADVGVLDYSEAQSLTIAGTSGFVPSDWPVDAAAQLPDGEMPCARLQSPEGASAPSGVMVPSGGRDLSGGAVRVEAGHGAVVQLDGSGTLEGWAVIDESGTLFPVPANKPDVLSLLGYAEDDVARVPYFWSALFPTGPTLTVEAAARQLGEDGA